MIMILTLIKMIIFIILIVFKSWQSTTTSSSSRRSRKWKTIELKTTALSSSSPLSYSGRKFIKDPGKLSSSSSATLSSWFHLHIIIFLSLIIMRQMMLMTKMIMISLLIFSHFSFVRFQDSSLNSSSTAIMIKTPPDWSWLPWGSCDQHHHSHDHRHQQR